MITAKNYVAQAQKGLINTLPNVSPRMAKPVELICKLLGEAVHFVMPDSGKIMDDHFKGLNDLPLELPFSSFTIEFLALSKTGYKIKKVIFIDSDDEKIFVHTIHGEGENWFIVPAVAIVDKLKSFSVSDVLSCFHTRYMDCVSLQDNNYTITLDTQVAGSMCNLFELLEALSCRNVSTINFQEASPANVKRVKSGKLPFYETKMLVINSRTACHAKSDSSPQTHASPKQHLRRGHIRRLQNGNIWVNSCVVGDPTKGIINKQYLVV